jgi:xyloglucan:xyloglucosyl transferase
MALLPAVALLVMAMAAASSDAQPSPGYYPSSRFRPVAFNRPYSNKFCPQHQTLSGDHSALTIWLDRTCGTYARAVNSFLSFFIISVGHVSDYLL